MEGHDRGPGRSLAELVPGHGREIPLTVPGVALCFAPFMKVVSSIKSAKKRHPDCQVVRRRGKIYVINKTDPRYKARQG